MDADDLFKEECAYYEAHKAELLSKYLGKEVVICKDTLVGAFDNLSDAADFTLEQKFAPGTFMIKHVAKKEPVYQMIPLLVLATGGDDE